MKDIIIETINQCWINADINNKEELKLWKENIKIYRKILTEIFNDIKRIEKKG